MNEIVRALPTSESLDRIADQLAPHEPWFYEFRFSNGASTKASNDLAQLVHRTRAELIFPLLDSLIGSRWPDTRSLDVACNEGWFAMQLAARGAAHVTGIDIREEHILKANLIKRLSDFEDLTFESGDVLDLTPEKHGAFDLTLLLGLLYHVDNPLGILRAVRAVTRRLCVIETQVARGSMRLECQTLTVPEVRQGPAVALVSSNQAHVEQGKSLVLVPTLDALYEMLYSVGFSRLYLVVPTPVTFEQYRQYDRVVLFAM